ncbi:MAG: hypothetical protein QW035_02500 [Candidatus Anstonellales archaeon]
MKEAIKELQRLNKKEGKEAELLLDKEASDVATKVVRVMMKQSFRRDRPAFPEELEKRVKDAIKEGKDIELVVLWGGPKKTEQGVADETDKAALNHLLELKQEVDKELSSTKSSLKLTMLFCGDIHQLLASGLWLSKTKKYFKSLKSMAEGIGFRVKRLKDFYVKWYWQKSKKEELMIIKPTPTPKELLRVVNEDEWILYGNKEKLKEYLGNYKEAVVEKVKAASEKHSLLLKDGVMPEIPVALYIEVEKDFLNILNKEEYRHAIFGSYGNPEVHKEIIKDISAPMLFLWPIKRGRSDPPWYPAESNPTEEPHKPKTIEQRFSKGSLVNKLVNAINTLLVSAVVVLSATTLSIPAKLIPYQKPAYTIEQVEKEMDEIRKEMDRVEKNKKDPSYAKNVNMLENRLKVLSEERSRLMKERVIEEKLKQ